MHNLFLYAFTHNRAHIYCQLPQLVRFALHDRRRADVPRITPSIECHTKLCLERRWRIGEWKEEWVRGWRVTASAAAAALNTNDYYMQAVSGQREIQSTLRILDGAKTLHAAAGG